MPGSLPSSLGLTSIADGSLIVAADPRNNFTAIQTAVNALIAALGVTAKGDLLAASASGALTNVAVGANGTALVADSTQTGGVKWATVATTPYRKNTPKAVNNSVVETDLLNGEITIGAGVLGTTGRLRCSFDTDLLANSGAPATWKFKVKLGGTTVFDTGAITVANQGANRSGLSIDFSLLNTGAAATNVCKLRVAIPAVALGTTTAPVMTAVGTGEKWTIVEAAATTTIDTATSKLLEVTVTHGTAAATIETKLYGALVEVL